MKDTNNTGVFKQLDWITTIVPFIFIVLLCALFMLNPEGSSAILGSIRYFLGDQLGSYYLVIGLGVFLCSCLLYTSRCV